MLWESGSKLDQFEYYWVAEQLSKQIVFRQVLTTLMFFQPLNCTAVTRASPIVLSSASSLSNNRNIAKTWKTRHRKNWRFEKVASNARRCIDQLFRENKVQLRARRRRPSGQWKWSLRSQNVYERCLFNQAVCKGYSSRTALSPKVTISSRWSNDQKTTRPKSEK